MIEKLYEIKPKSIVYLFSGGKDSALALLKTRDIVKRYVAKLNVKVYIVHITITDNTHPLNVYAAASVMYWHKQHYGFEPVFLARDRLFQEYVAKYGLQLGPRRWCYLEFKAKLLLSFESRLPRPVLEIDGMKRSDSKQREAKLENEIELVERSNGFRFYAWHPLIDYNGDPLEELRKYREFEPIVKLYEVFGDSMNCVVCPYKTRMKYAKYNNVEILDPIIEFVSITMRSKTFLRLFNSFKIHSLEEFIKSKTG